MDREITYRCGHAARTHVGGWCVAEQDRAAARLARRRCPACAATATATPIGPTPASPALPPLAGSPRQVAWAEAIRRDRLAALGRVDPDAVRRVAAMADARWWIDRRTADPRAIAAG